MNFCKAYTPLHCAAFFNNVGNAMELLRRGASLTPVNRSGQTALNVAESRKHEAMMALLKRAVTADGGFV